MTQLYALINPDDDSIIKYRNDINPIPREQLAPNKPYWVPVVDEIEDKTTSSINVTRNTLKDKVVDGKVVRKTILKHMTTEEIDLKEKRRAIAITEHLEKDMVFKLLYDMNNQIEILKGNKNLTIAEFKEKLKGYS